jgi:hypothetical protein
MADVSDQASEAIDGLKRLLNPDSQITTQGMREQIQTRMSDSAGILCQADDVALALEDAKALNAQLRGRGISFSRPNEIARVFQWQQMALASEAVLAALNAYISSGGGSRGARAICDAQGDALPMSSKGPLTDFQFRSEREDHKSEQITVRLYGTQMKVATRANRIFNETDKAFFERDWPAWLTGGIYDKC